MGQTRLGVMRVCEFMRQLGENWTQEIGTESSQKNKRKSGAAELLCGQEYQEEK